MRVKINFIKIFYESVSQSLSIKKSLISISMWRIPMTQQSYLVLIIHTTNIHCRTKIYKV